jgi:hypothetical protein
MSLWGRDRGRSWSRPAAHLATVEEPPLDAVLDELELVLELDEEELPLVVPAVLPLVLPVPGLVL